MPQENRHRQPSSRCAVCLRRGDAVFGVECGDVAQYYVTEADEQCPAAQRLSSKEACTAAHAALQAAGVLVPRSDHSTYY